MQLRNRSYTSMAERSTMVSQYRKTRFLKLVLCLLLAASLNLGHAATIVSIRTGNWFTDTNNDAVAWGAIVPSGSDNVTITNGVFFNGTANGEFGVQNLDIGTGGSLIFSSGALRLAELSGPL